MGSPSADYVIVSSKSELSIVEGAKLDMSPVWTYKRAVGDVVGEGMITFENGFCLVLCLEVQFMERYLDAHEILYILGQRQV